MKSYELEMDIGTHCRSDLLGILDNYHLDNGVDITGVEGICLANVLKYIEMARDNSGRGCGACREELKRIRSTAFRKPR